LGNRGKDIGFEPPGLWGINLGSVIVSKNLSITGKVKWI
jgi:hypothetical protein